MYTDITTEWMVYTEDVRMSTFFLKETKTFSEGEELSEIDRQRVK